MAHQSSLMIQRHLISFITASNDACSLTCLGEMRRNIRPRNKSLDICRLRFLVKGSDHNKFGDTARITRLADAAHSVSSIFLPSRLRLIHLQHRFHRAAGWTGTRRDRHCAG